jgi:hypothetical protein
MVIHAYNRSTWEARELEPAWATSVKGAFSYKFIKLISCLDLSPISKISH